MTVQLGRINSTALRALPRGRTVFFFAVGPLEDHGPHLPLGLDLIEAERVSTLVAEKIEKEMTGWTAVMMPPVPLGIDSNTTSLAIIVRPHVIRDWLVDACTALHKQGFRYFACFTGHTGPKQLTAIEEAGRILRRRGGLFRKQKPVLVSALSGIASKRSLFSSSLWPDPGEHGGARDTSIALAASPDLVTKEYGSLPPRERPRSLLRRLWRHATGKTSGYWGNPSQAGAREGSAALETLAGDVFERLKLVLSGAAPEKHFRSRYSIFPTNRSFFKAWVLFSMVTALLCAWIYIVFRMLVPG